MQFIKRFAWRNPIVVDCIKNIFSQRCIANSPLYRLLTLHRARTYARTHPSGYLSVAIETALSCNSRCIMCAHAYHDLHGFMGMDLFRKIIGECCDLGIGEVCLSVYGEPLVDPFFFERIEYLRSRNVNYGFFTNGSLLDKSKAAQLLQRPGLVRINFSICGFRKEVYEKVMQGLKREIVYKNVLDFLDLKKKYSRHDLTVAISTVKTSETAPELNDFVRFWKRHRGVNQIIVADLWERIGEKDVRTIGPIGRMHKASRWMAPCLQLWGGVNIYFEFRVAPCCDDADERHLIIGDCTTQTLREIFASEQLQALRLLHLADKRNQHAVCKGCFHNSVWVI